MAENELKRDIGIDGIDLTGCTKIGESYVKEILELRLTDEYLKVTTQEKQDSEMLIINRFLRTLDDVDSRNAK